MINFDSSAQNIWTSVLDHAYRAHRLDALLSAVDQDLVPDLKAKLLNLKNAYLRTLERHRPRRTLDFTQRDIVLSTLVALETAWANRPQDCRSDGFRYNEIWTATLRQILISLIDTVGDIERTVGACLYGLPSWLINRSEPSSSTSFYNLAATLDEPNRINDGTLKTAVLQLCHELNQNASSWANRASGGNQFLLYLYLELRDRSPSLENVIDNRAQPWKRFEDRGRRIFHLAARDERAALREQNLTLTLLQSEFDSDSLDHTTQGLKRTASLSESIARLSRFDIPLCGMPLFGTPSSGMLLGARLESATERVDGVRIDEEHRAARVDRPGGFLQIDPDWQPIDASFRQGVENGLAASRALLEQLGLSSDEYRAVDLELFAVVPPTTISGSSAALPVALEVLRQSFDLPQGPYAASGALEIKRSGPNRAIETYSLRPLDEATERGKALAVREDGYRTALLCAGQGEHASAEGVVRVHLPAGLMDAAKLMWGPLFDEVIDRRRHEWLHHAGFWPSWRTTNDLDFQRVSTEQAETIYKAILSSSEVEISPRDRRPVSAKARPGIFFLSSPARTGKTRIAQEVVTQLLLRGWEVAVLSVRRMTGAIQTLTDPAMLLQLTTREIDLLRSDRPRLMVIDGIEYDERLRELREELEYIADRHCISFLIVRRADNFSNWDMTQDLSFNAITGTEALRTFANRLLATQDADLGRQIAIDAAVASRDLGWLVDVASGNDPKARITDLVKGLRGADPERLKNLAYASYWGIGVPERLLEGINQTAKEAISPYIISSTSIEDGWILIASRHVAKVLIDILDPPSSGRSPRAPSRAESLRSISRVVDYLINSAEESKELHFIDALADVCWRLSSNPHASALLNGVYTKERSDRITALAQHDALGRPSMLSLFSAISTYLRTEDAIVILARIMIRCHEELKNDRISCSDLRACLEVLHRNRGLIGRDFDERGQASALEKVWSDIKTDIPTTFARLLRDETVRRERVALIGCLLSFRDAEVDLKIPGIMNDILDDAIDGGDVDATYVFRIVDIAARLRLILDGPEGDDRAVRGWARNLIDSAPRDLPGRSLLQECQLERLRLRLGLISQDWPAHHGELNRRISLVLPTSNMNDLIAGFEGIYRERPGYFIKYLNDFNPFDRLVLDPRHDAGAIANLAAALSRWHLESAFDLFYLGSELKPGQKAIPNSKRARAFAKVIRAQRDGRNAGRLIIAATKIDGLFRNQDANFAEQLINQVNKDFFEAQFQFENRSAILFYLTEGLLLAQHPYFSELLPKVVEHLGRAIEIGFQPWAARLAFRICRDPKFGTEARKRIQEVIERHSERILEAMLSASDPEIAAALHGLALLDCRERGLAELFSQRIRADPRLEELLHGLERRGRPDMVVTALRAIDATLRRSGDGLAGAEIVEAAAARRRPALPEEKDERLVNDSKQATRMAHTLQSVRWRGVFLGKGDAEDTAALLDQLRLLHSGLARATLRSARVFSPARGKGILADKIRRLERSPGQVVRLLVSADAVLPGVGRHLLAIFMEAESRARVIKDEIQFIQNPRTFAMVARLLIRFGYRPIEHLSKPFEAVWSRSDIIGSLRSAAALSELMRLAAALDRIEDCKGGTGSRLTNIAACIDINALERRIMRRQPLDLEFFPALIIQLENAGRWNVARHLLRVLVKTNLAQLIDIDTWAKTLVCCLYLAEQPGADVISAMDLVAARLLSEPSALDDLAQWRSFVLYAAARACLQKDLDEPRGILLEQCPRSLKQISDPGLRFLAVHWLEECSWTRDMKASSIASIRSAPGRVSLDVRNWLNAVFGFEQDYRPDIAIARWENAPRSGGIKASERLHDFVKQQAFADEARELALAE
ncbi:hypothetical protein [Bradyrhizobium sp. ORS 375]|uniref:hypothetical protein n=1 Tax=Bradyrhizobium sp. (strain ORS 375) TaxID=566679 RepID=UPI0011121EC3|nr:hypothetical protein [Bradyrhizobium sp. ORS 375]